jgi:hypothetical protein
MSVLDLILKHGPRVRLLWEKRCDCAQGDRNPLVWPSTATRTAAICTCHH